MDELNRDVYLVQNPAIGAAILWRFVCGYYDSDIDGKQVPFLLLFIVLPIIFREDLRDAIDSTRESSRLHKFSENLFKKNRADLLFSIHDSVDQYKEITLLAINIAVGAGLISISSKTALVTPIQTVIRKTPKTSEPLLKLSKKLGVLCSTLSLYEISTLLKVRF